MRAPDPDHLAQAEAEDVDVVDGMLDQAPTAGLGDVGAPGGAVGPLNRKVLVVTDRGGHRPPQRARRHQRPQGAKDRGGTQDQPRLGRHADGGDRVDQRPRAGEVGGQRLLAEDGARVPTRAASTAPRWATVGVQTQTASHRSTRPLRSPATSAPWAAGKSLGPPRTAIEHHGDVGLDHAGLDHRLQSQPVGPGDQARPDKPDPQHDADTRREAVSSCHRSRRRGQWACSRHPRASTKRPVTTTSMEMPRRSRRRIGAGLPRRR